VPYVALVPYVVDWALAELTRHAALAPNRATARAFKGKFIVSSPLVDGAVTPAAPCDFRHGGN
jgi:hypothetical protein